MWTATRIVATSTVSAACRRETQHIKYRISMERSKTGVLLVNVGTPDSPATADVRRYLRQFLMDGRIIDIPYWRRFLLVHLIIAPLRAPKSSKEYRKLWTEKGSPLLYHSIEFRDRVQQKLGDDFIVALAMRYQNPSMESALETLRQYRPSSIVLFPLFPQYASATVGSVHEKAMRIMQRWPEIPKLHFIDSFYDHPKVIETFARRGMQHLNDERPSVVERERYDHVLFTYHGLPERQLEKSNPDCLGVSSCCDTIHAGNHLCYRAQCYAMSRISGRRAWPGRRRIHSRFSVKVGERSLDPALYR